MPSFKNPTSPVAFKGMSTSMTVGNASESGCKMSRDNLTSPIARYPVRTGPKGTIGFSDPTIELPGIPGIEPVVIVEPMIV